MIDLEKLKEKVEELKKWQPIATPSLDKLISFAEKMENEPTDKGEISDGYHTFNELYNYRMLYNAAFFNSLANYDSWADGSWEVEYDVHKSKRHNDGEECFGGGWFIVMAELPTGQISNHYEMKYWNLFNIPEKVVANKWDGHTPQQAAERLEDYLRTAGEGLEKSETKEQKFDYLKKWNFDKKYREPKTTFYPEVHGDAVVDESGYHFKTDLKTYNESDSLEREIERYGSHIPFNNMYEILDDRTHSAIAKHYYNLGKIAGKQEQAEKGITVEGTVYTSAFTSYVKTPGIEEKLFDKFKNDTDVIVQVREKEEE